MKFTSTIQQLIQLRCNQLNISYKQLIIKSGYSNITVGLKRLNQLFENNYQAAEGLIKKLPAALDLPAAEINQAVLCSKLEQKAAQDELERLWFRPNFIIRTKNDGKPKQIFIAAILNAGQYVQGDFPVDLHVSDYKKYAIAHFHEHCMSIIAFYEEPIDIVINYAYEHAEVISLEGDHISRLNKHINAGQLSYEI